MLEEINTSQVDSALDLVSEVKRELERFLENNNPQQLEKAYSTITNARLILGEQIKVMKR